MTSVKKLDRYVKENNIDTFLVTKGSSFRYLSNYKGKFDERFIVIAFGSSFDPFILLNELAESHIGETSEIRKIFWQDGQNAIEIFTDEVNKRVSKVETLFINKDCPASIFIELKGKWPSSKVFWTDEILCNLRKIKTAEEQNYMRHGCSIAENALKKSLERGSFWIGKSEQDFALHLKRTMEDMGLSTPGCIAAVGKNAANPHYIPGKAKIKNNSCLLIDFTGTYNGYFSDMTRMVFFGKPDHKFKLVYDIVKEANQIGVSSAVIGQKMGQIDFIVRDYITSKGYGKNFTHRTGHGIGLDMHEKPNVEFGEESIIEPGLTFSIEPGIYLSGEFGIRIEDQVLITESGPVRLHNMSRDLIVI